MVNWAMVGSNTQCPTWKGLYFEQLIQSGIQWIPRYNVNYDYGDPWAILEPVSGIDRHSFFNGGLGREIWSGSTESKNLLWVNFGGNRGHAFLNFLNNSGRSEIKKDIWLVISTVNITVVRKKSERLN